MTIRISNDVARDNEFAVKELLKRSRVNINILLSFPDIQQQELIVSFPDINKAPVSGGGGWGFGGREPRRGWGGGVGGWGELPVSTYLPTAAHIPSNNFADSPLFVPVTAISEAV